MLERLKQLDRQTVIALVVAGVVSLLLFGAIAGVIRQAGWNEGFLYGLLASDGDAKTALTPYLSGRGYGPHGWGWHPFGLIGGFFKFFFFVFLLMIFFKFLGFLRWGMHGGRHWRHHHGPPWGNQQGGEAAPGSTQPGEPKTQQTGWTNV
jgi:hypothetical protein